MEEKSMTFAQRAELKMELTVNEPLSFSQICDLKKIKRQVKILWQENRELYDYLEKARMYSLLIEKPEMWEEFWKENQFKIGFKVINEFFKKLKYRECAFCGNPFPQGRADNIYCSPNCRHNEFLRRQEENIKTTA